MVIYAIISWGEWFGQTCPAVSHIWSLTRSPLISIVRILKSTPADRKDVNTHFLLDIQWYTDGGDVVASELIICKSDKQRTFSNSRVSWTDKYHLQGANIKCKTGLKQLLIDPTHQWWGVWRGGHSPWLPSSFLNCPLVASSIHPVLLGYPGRSRPTVQVRQVFTQGLGDHWLNLRIR